MVKRVTLLSLGILALNSVATAQVASCIPPQWSAAMETDATETDQTSDGYGIETVSCSQLLNGCGADGGCGATCMGCGEGCDNGCGEGCLFGGNGGWLGGLTFKSDRAFDTFIEPVSNPVFFEDPRSRTRLRMIFINQQIPGGSILGGGDFQVYGMQATVALNDRLSIIAQKDGFISLQADAIPHADGWADLGTGLKYVLVRDVQNQFLLSVGSMLEWSNGSSEVFQGNGDGVFNFFLTSGKAFGRCDQNHFIGTVGWHLPVDSAAESESLFYSLHLDRHLGKGFYGLVELNGIQYVNNGGAAPGLTVEGGDLINLGAGAVDGNSFVSFAFGATQKVNSNLELAAAWEFPITGRQDLMENRLTTTLSLIY